MINNYVSDYFFSEWKSEKKDAVKGAVRSFENSENIYLIDSISITVKGGGWRPHRCVLQIKAVTQLIVSSD